MPGVADQIRDSPDPDRRLAWFTVLMRKNNPTDGDAARREPDDLLSDHGNQHSEFLHRNDVSREPSDVLSEHGKQHSDNTVCFELPLELSQPWKLTIVRVKEPTVVPRRIVSADNPLCDPPTRDPATRIRHWPTFAQC